MKYTAVDYGTGGIYRRMPARKELSKDREWFGMTIVASGRHIAVWVNGVQATDWTDERPTSDNARKGCCLGEGGDQSARARGAGGGPGVPRHPHSGLGGAGGGEEAVTPSTNRLAATRRERVWNAAPVAVAAKRIRTSHRDFLLRVARRGRRDVWASNQSSLNSMRSGWLPLLSFVPRIAWLAVSAMIASTIATSPWQRGSRLLVLS